MSISPAVRVPGIDRSFSIGRILTVLMLPLGMSLMAVSAVNVALPTIEVGLGATSSDIQWVLSGYGLAFGMSLIPAGRLGDARGRGSYFVAGVALFTLASVLCGLAPTPLVLNIFRLLQGIGSGLIGPQTTGMILQYFSGHHRAKAFSLFGLVISVSVAIGPLFAGSIIALLGPELGWRGAFLINGPLGLIALVMALRWLPFETERHRRRQRAKGAETESPDLDPVGAFLVAGAVLCLMTPFMMRGAWEWWLLLPLGIALAVAWVLWEQRYQSRGREPMVRMDLFRYPSFSFGTAISATQFLGGASTFAIVALYLQQGVGLSALETGLVTLPNALLSALTAVWVSRHVLGHGRRIVVVCLSIMITGVLATLALAPFVTTHDLPAAWMAATLALIGLGMGAYGSANQTLALHDVPIEVGGSAGAVKQTAERTSAAMGNAVVTAIFFTVAGIAGLATAFMVSFAVIAAFMITALGLGIGDLLNARRRHAASTAGVGEALQTA